MRKYDENSQLLKNGIDVSEILRHSAKFFFPKTENYNYK